MKSRLLFLTLLFFFNDLSAQHQDVFPGVIGDELLENLIDAYKLNAYPNQATNRDTLFGAIDSTNDSLTCVYTSYKIWLDPSKDPTQAAFKEGINTEHTFPKSLGAEGFAEGDMHHLYASREDVNNDRGNFPFGEVPDNETQSWYYLSQETSSIPSNNIELYAERKDGLFEPPEAHKGNVARAMMYFYTMYKEVADNANPTYFEAQRETLCNWHYLDPVDQKEWDRTWKIATYQENKPNPFVLDCTLPERSYCQEFGQSCEPTATTEIQDVSVFSFDNIAPNPIREGAVFYFSSSQSGEVSVDIFDLHGTILETVNLGYYAEGEHTAHWECSRNLPVGTIIYQLSLKTNKGITKMVRKAVVLR